MRSRFTIKTTIMAVVTGMLLLLFIGMSYHYIYITIYNVFAEKVITNAVSYGPENGSAPKRAMILLQGTGMSADEMIKVSDVMAPRMSDTVFIAPEGILLGKTPGTYRWFETYGRTNTHVYAWGVPAATRAVLAFIEKVHQETGIPYRNIGVVGLSQGGTLALQLAMRSPEPLWGVVSFAGVLYAAPEEERIMFVPMMVENVNERDNLEIHDIQTPILMFHGTRDVLLPFVHSAYALDVLSDYADDITLLPMQDAGHDIYPGAVVRATAFLKKRQDGAMH